MSKYYVLPYSMKSMGARLFAKTLGATILINRGDTSPCTEDDTVINWGCASERRGITNPLNSYNAVRIASNKLHTYRALDEAGIPTVKWTENMAIAQDWLEAGQALYARSLVNSHGGRGTTVINPGEALPNAVFYTAAFPPHREFRVHVIGTTTIVQEKKKKREFTNHNMNIRNKDNGWVFCINDLAPYPEIIKSTSIAAVKNLGLNFGALDIAIDAHDNLCVFEVNTAPGLTKRTAQMYEEAFKYEFPLS